MRRLWFVFPSCFIACGTSAPAAPPPADAEVSDTAVPDAAVEASAACPQEDNVVAVTGGCIRGVTSGSLHSFLGVPYAAPPIGGLRWKPPADPIAWTGVRGANAVSKA